MYHKYRTEALVLGREARGEGDALITLLTKEFGLVRTEVKSVRLERSHLRYALQTFSLVDATLVRGKTTWRVAGARGMVAYGMLLAHTHARAAMARLALLLRRLVRGDFLEASACFLVYRDAFAALLLAGEDTERVRAVEALCALRLLHILGYVAPAPSSLLVFLEQPRYEDTILSEATRRRAELVRTINASLAASQL